MKKIRKKPKFLNSMENEIIVAIAVLYALIVSIMVIVHYAQPSIKKIDSSSYAASTNK